MSDYIFMLESRLSAEQLSLLAQVQQAAERAEMHLFLAGGAIRDLLGGFPIRDLDFCVEGPALKLVRQLDPLRFTIVSTDKDRQAAEVVFGGSATGEIAMCRREHYAKAGGRPEISRATIQDDLRRRDFSVNAIALSLNPASRGLLLDPTNGLADIEHKNLRALYNYSFYDHPLRLLRLLRLKARLKYSIDEKTKSQLEGALEAGMAEHITSRDRLTELRQLASEPDTAEAVKTLAAGGLLRVFEPHLQGKKLDPAALAKLDKARRLVEGSGVHVDNFGPFLQCLTSKLSGAERSSLRKRAGMRAKDAAAWINLESRAKILQKTLSAKQMAQNSRLYRTLESQDPAVALYLLAFSSHQTVRERIKNHFTKLRPLAASLTDEEIEQVGVKRGSPKFARLREAYLTARLDKKITSKTTNVAKVLGAELQVSPERAGPGKPKQ